MAVQRKYRINLKNYGNPPAIQLSQYDTGYALVFEVYDGPSPSATLAAYTVKLIGTRADNLGYEFTGTVGGTANNVLSFTIDNTISAVAGRGTAEIQIIDSQNDILFASFNMSVFVEKAAKPNSVIDADVEAEQTLAEQIEAMVDEATGAVTQANDAKDAAETAQGKAEDAQEAAETAQGKAEDAQEAAETAKDSAETNALKAEGYAVGKQNGTDVASDSDYYQNNAKYYKEQAASSATSASGSATAAAGSATAAASNTAPTYSSSATYTVGDYCVYNSQLYRCTTAITTAEAWTAAHWTAATVGDEISLLKEDLSKNFTTGMKNAILDCFKNVAWTTPDGETYLDTLESLFNGDVIGIVNNLTNCTTSNSATYVNKNASYTATISAVSETALANADVSITMGGVDITASAYSNGTISIASVTAEVFITITIAEGYTLYDYIGQTGAVHNDRNIIVDDLAVSTDNIIETSLYYSLALSQGFEPVMGTRHGSGVKNFAVFIKPATGGLGYWWGGSDTLNTYTPFVVNQVNTIEFIPVGESEAYPNNMTIDFNNIELDSGSTVSGTTSDEWFAFFGYAQSKTTAAGNGNIGLRIGETIIKSKTGTVLRDFIPASDGTHKGLYDTVTDNFYYNADGDSVLTLGMWDEVA